MGTLARSFRPDTPYPEFIAQLNNYTKTLDNQNRFEIVGEGTSSFPDVTVIGTGAGYFHDSALTTVTHNLGFAPICNAYILVGGVRIPLNYTQTDSNDAGGANLQAYWWDVAVLTDTTQIKFRSSVTFNFASAGSALFNGAPIQYYLLRATAGSV